MAEALLEQLVTRSAQQDQRIAQLLEQLKNPAPVQFVPAAPNADNVRKEKVQSINLNTRESNKLKIFKATADTDIELFLKKFKEELNNMKVLVGIDGNLTRNEYVPLIQIMLRLPSSRKGYSSFN